MSNESPAVDPVDALRVLVKAAAAAAADMDRAGGDGYGMPQCPWCRAQDSRDGDDKYHDGDCELVALRDAIATAEAAEARLSAPTQRLARVREEIAATAIEEREISEGMYELLNRWAQDLLLSSPPRADQRRKSHKRPA